jgi:hypothetical protein
VTLPPTAGLEVCPPGEDVLAAIALRAEAVAEEAGWGGERDAPNQWWWLHDNGHLAGASPSLSSIAMVKSKLGPDLELLHPVELVNVFEEHLHEVAQTLMGFVLVAEAWMLSYQPDDRAGRERVFDVANRREVWRQPDRMEIRAVRLQMLTGQDRCVLRIRGQDPMLVGDVPPSRDVMIEVPAALARLATVLRRRKYGRRG